MSRAYYVRSIFSLLASYFVAVFYPTNGPHACKCTFRWGSLTSTKTPLTTVSKGATMEVLVAIMGQSPNFLEGSLCRSAYLPQVLGNRH